MEIESSSPMKPTLAATRRCLARVLLGGLLFVGTGCPQGSDDPLDEIRRLHARNRYEETLESLRALMDENPTDPGVNYLFAKTLMQMGEPSLAIWPLQRAVKSPEYAFDAGMMLALATLDSRTPANAVDAVDLALAVEPENVEALALRGHANFKAGRYVDALADIERAVHLDPDNPAVFVPRVLVLLEFDRIDEAEAVLAAAEGVAQPREELALEETQARLCLTNATFAFEREDRKSAEVMFADCLEAYPSDPRVVLRVVGFYDALGEPERATDLLRRTFEDTRSTEFGYALARRIRRLGTEEPSVPPPAPIRPKRSDGSDPDWLA